LRSGSGSGSGLVTGEPLAHSQSVRSGARASSPQPLASKAQAAGRRETGEPMTKKRVGCQRTAPLPALDCPQSSRQRGRSPASPTATAARQGESVRSPGTFAGPTASTPWVVHDKRSSARSQRPESWGACDASDGAVSPCPAAQQQKGRRGCFGSDLRPSARTANRRPAGGKQWSAPGATRLPGCLACAATAQRSSAGLYAGQRGRCVSRGEFGCRVATR
jgi:hypothetical protein